MAESAPGRPKRMKTGPSEETGKRETVGNNAEGDTFTLREVTGDLFCSPMTNSLAHCVSKDLRMGKGIAVLFKQKFHGVTELKEQKKKVGEVAVLKHGGRFLYYLITKEFVYHKPTYDTLRQSLEAMREHIEANSVTELSIPRIGCGLDKLEWPKVTDILKEVFAKSALTITVYTM